MDQIKIGKFIKECRKKKGLTQEQLANKLLVDFKTVSKWECGRGMPDVSIIKSLCENLDITLAEMFVGEHIDDENHYREMTEKAILETIENEKIKNRISLVGEIIVGVSLILIDTLVILIAGLVPMDTAIRVILIIVSITTIIFGIVGLVLFDVNVGYFECKNCHERFVPTLKEYIFGLHTFKKRKLTCPKCKATTWCNKRLTRK